MNTALKATSVRDLKDAARAINFVLKNKIKGKAAVAALCDLLEVTARVIREESLGKKPQRGGLDPNYIGPVVAHGFRKKNDGTTSDWSRRFKSVDAVDVYLATNVTTYVEYILPADCDR